MLTKLVLALTLISGVFSIDIFLDRHKTVFSAHSNAELFGYSVLLNECTEDLNSSDLCLIRVGAPKTLTSIGIRTGAVFQCNTQQEPLNGHVNCTEDEIVDRNRPLTSFLTTDDIWYGATIVANEANSYIACAPRLWKLYGTRDVSYMLMYGGCVISKRNGSKSYLIPFSNTHSLAFTVDSSREKEYPTNATFFYYAFAQAGMSIKFVDQQKIIIGAPGILQWTGGVSEYSSTCDRFGCRNFSPKAFVNPFFINEVKQDDYLGYSVEAGAFDDSGNTLYLSGAPRSGKGYGQVLIYEPMSFRVKKVLTGPHLGSYFGATLLCADVNGDGFLDILVGAPNYVSIEERLAFDHGSVIVYLNYNSTQSDIIFEQQNLVTGSNENGARFGSAIANLGDINDDGYNDIAIGAPWAGNGDLGAVYIYRGSKFGLESKYMQKITAEGSKSFGFSISNGYDVDFNNCNDFAVGAPNSNTVYLYKCIPSIAIQAHILIHDVLSLHQDATNFTAVFGISTTPVDKHLEVELYLKGIITVHSNNNEVTLLGDSEFFAVIRNGDFHMHEKQIQVEPTANLSKPITIQFKIEENTELMLDKMKYGRVAEYSKLYARNDVKLMRDCGSDLKCTPLLTLEILSSVGEKDYVPGSGQKLGVTITVLNKEEPAYDAKVLVALPLLPKRVPSGCSLEYGNMTCYVISPLNRMKSDTWELEFEYDNSPTNIPRILHLNASLEQINIYTKINKGINIRIASEPTISLKGKVFPNKTILVTREDLHNEANISFSHIYEIKNSGPSPYYNLNGIITHPEMVIIKKIISNSDEDIENTFKNVTTFEIFEIPANATVTLTTKLIFNLQKYGVVLDQSSHINFSSTINLPRVYKKGFGFISMNAKVPTTLVLEPASPFWPIIVGVFGGLLILCVIIFIFNKCGFFSRPKHENLKKLKMEEPASSEEITPSCSNIVVLNEFDSSQLIFASDTDNDKDINDC